MHFAERRMDDSWRISGLLDNHPIWGVGQAVLSLAHHSSFVLFVHAVSALSFHAIFRPRGLGDDPLSQREVVKLHC